MITWNDFERQQPALAGTGRRHLYQFGIGLAFRATVRPDDGFALAGRAAEVTDRAVMEVVRGQVRAERGGQVWPGFDEEVIFELGIKNCLLMLTQDGEAFPAGPTIWKAGRLKAELRNAAGGRRSDMVT
jgi:hypothetical protein